MNMSSIKKFLYTFMISSMIFYITVKMLSGIETSGQLIHLLLAFLLFVIPSILVKHTLRFFTLPSNFLTYLLILSILNFAAFYGISLLLPGIRIGETLIDPVSMGIVSINPYTLTSFLTMVFASLVSALMTSTLYWLKKE